MIDNYTPPNEMAQRKKKLIKRPFTSHPLLSYSDGSEARLRVGVELRPLHRQRHAIMPAFI